LTKGAGLTAAALDQMVRGSSAKAAGADTWADIDTEFAVSAAVLDRGVPGTNYVR